ncbi:transmembrane protein 135-like [Macrosteles quadrilineatus]|uniref:transmembrane protein 135-like n=1 Tax=Macrosteles quadrilineatus TaxID=74068 RepID=UPI0023E0FA9C|nr:transmembrane protein 135-like [Macrosteles quadrilineatus]XP_054269285.1 transmembrane protein 135-like [Macrosteles quadrilineatus]
MTILSKQRYQLIRDLNCEVLHPWTSSCAYNALGTFLQSVKGSTKFFLLIYLLQNLPKKQSYQKHVLLQQLVNFCKSCLFGGFAGGTSVACMCFLRWILGRYTPYTLGLIPGFIGGAGIFIEDNSRRETNLTLFIAMVSDLYLKVFKDEKVLEMTLTKEILLFTTCSSLLLYCLRAFKDSYTVLWPFTPHKLPNDPERRKQCPHSGECLEDIKKTAVTFVCYGAALQCFKVLTLNFLKLFYKPSSFFKAFFKLDNLRLPFFAGLYVSLFKGVSCALVQTTGRDEAWHALPAGVVASLCYLIQPNLSLALFALSNLSQILCKELRRRWDLPRWYYKEIAFMVCMGLLYHARAVFPHCFPPYMFNIMDTVTVGRAEIVYGLVEKHLLIRTV